VANRAVRNERYRPDILARAPASGDDVVLDLSDAGGGLLRFGMGDRGRRVLEDSLGVRWADVHPGLHQKLTLAIPAPRWGADLFFVESVSEDAEYRLRGGAEVDLTKLAPQPRRVLRRGALHEAFALLFALPFDDTTTMPPVDLDLQRRLDGADEGTAPRSFWTHDRKRAAATGAAVGGAAGFVAAGVFAVSAASLRREAEGQNGADRSLVDDQIARRNGWTVATSVGSVLLAATAIALYGWSRSDER
jgi:hypothetical protein